jgi:serine/threonine protein kinase
LDDWDPRAWLNQDVHGYKVKEHIATGATGYVLRASFGTAASEMALKIPILKTTTGAAALNETMAEATTLSELSGQSKYVVQIKGILVDRMNIQEIMKGDTGLYLHSPPTIVMEYMRGGNAKRLVEDPSYDALYYSEKWGGVVILMGQMISTALEMIHGAGFVHLDVKPQNILFTATPPPTGQDMLEQMVSGKISPKLADLGSAVRTGGKVVQFTSEYAPVEQVLGSGADPSMDIYALGATLYSMLTKTPVHSKRLIEAMNNMISNPESNRAGDELRSLWKSFNPDFTRIDSKFSSIVPVLADMMAKDAKRRPIAREVSNSLRNVAGKYSG